jgi:actin-related protein
VRKNKNILYPTDKWFNSAITRKKLGKSCSHPIKLVWNALVNFVFILAIVQLLSNSLAKVDIDLRMTLYNEIVLSGGNTMFDGFP